MFARHARYFLCIMNGKKKEIENDAIKIDGYYVGVIKEMAHGLKRKTKAFYAFLFSFPLSLSPFLFNSSYLTMINDIVTSSLNVASTIISSFMYH